MVLLGDNRFSASRTTESLLPSVGCELFATTLALLIGSQMPIPVPLLEGNALTFLRTELGMIPSSFLRDGRATLQTDKGTIFMFHKQ